MPCGCVPVVPTVDALTFAGTDARGVAMFARSALTFWPFKRAKSAASKRKITASPLKLPGVTVNSADSLWAIGVPFNNESREKAITICTAHRKPLRLNGLLFVQAECENTQGCAFVTRRREGEDLQCRLRFYIFHR